MHTFLSAPAGAPAPNTYQASTTPFYFQQPLFHNPVRNFLFGCNKNNNMLSFLRALFLVHYIQQQPPLQFAYGLTQPYSQVRLVQIYNKLKDAQPFISNRLRNQ